MTVRLIAAALAALSPSSATALPSQTELEQLARDGVAEATSSWHASAQVVVVDGDRIVALPGGQIRIGNRAIATALLETQDRHVPTLVRWLMAHEVWHQVQFSRGFDPTTADAAMRRLAECEADVMASNLIASIMIGQSPQQLSESAAGEIAGTLKSVTQAIQRLESGAGGLLTHPSPQARLHAIRSGTARALHDALGTEGSAEAGAVRQRIARLYDMGSEEEGVWAGDICRMILHQEGAEDSLGLGSNQIQWNTSRDNPVVTYALPFRNVGTVPIRVTMQVRTVAIPRNQTDDYERWVMTDARRYQFELQPGASYTVGGQLEWYATEELMPRLLFPKRPFSLFHVTRLDPATQSTDAPVTVTPLSAEDEELKSSLQAIFAGATMRPAFRPVATNCEVEGDWESCDLIVPLPGVAKATVEREGDGSSEIYATIYEGADRDRAKESYRSFYRRLRAIFPVPRFADRTREDGTERVAFSPVNRVEVTLGWRRRTDEKYVTFLSVTPTF